MKLAAGVSYEIEVKSKKFEPYVRLENVKKEMLAEDKEPSGGSARIAWEAKADGYVRVVVSSNQGSGPFTIQVREKK